MLNVVGMMGPETVLIVAVVVLILFGGKKIPELLHGVGKGVGELQRGLDEGKRQLAVSVQEAAQPAPIATQPTTVVDESKAKVAGNPSDVKV